MQTRPTPSRLGVAEDFSQFPAGRFRSDGPHSGQSFRDDLLVPALRGGAVLVSLDGTMGYGSAFLEEAFGGLVRVHHFSASELRERLSFESLDRSLEPEIWSYVDGADRRPRQAP